MAEFKELVIICYDIIIEAYCDSTPAIVFVLAESDLHCRDKSPMLVFLWSTRNVML